MTEHERLPDNVHPEATLLPWYVNGTLSADERERIDRHLSTCVSCQHERGELVRLQKDLKLLYAMQAAPSIRLWETIRARVTAEAAAHQATSPPLSLLQRLDRWSRALFAPRWAPTTAMLLLATQAVLLIWLVQHPDRRETVTSRGLVPLAIRLHVELQPSTTEEQIRMLLQAMHARVIDGPSADGRYVIEIRSGTGQVNIEQILQTIRARADVVRSADLRNE